MNKSLLFFLMVVAATFSVAATDRFFIEDFLVLPGEVKQVEILLENEAQYTAFQADLYLPDDISLVPNSVELTNRKAANHSIATSQLSDGAIRMMSYSMNLSPYSGSSGTLVTFNVKMDQAINIPAAIVLKNILFTTTAGVEITFANEECSVFLRGDVNCDGNVSIADVTCLIDLLLAANQHPKSADVNDDGSVSISDVTFLIDVLLKA